MAVRPVFCVGEGKPAALRREVTFHWFAGLSVVQKQRSVASLHEEFGKRFPGSRVLEISSKSTEELGRSLSAFNLLKEVPSLGKCVPVECAYQGSKTFEKAGPFTDLYEAHPMAAKRDERLKADGHGPLTGFTFEGRTYPVRPAVAFYCWLYLCALLENPELAQALTAYDAFTDIEFNPLRSRSCQAHAAAIFVSLARRGLAQECRDFDRFLQLVF